MATLTFPLGDLIFFVCSFKNHMTCLSDFWSKIIKNILKIFHISCSTISKLLPSYFQYIQICLRFVSSLLFILWIILFETKLWFGRNPSKPSFIQSWINFITPNFVKLVSRLIHNVKFNKLNSWRYMFISTG
jgi:hypothetical protein